MSKVSFYIGFRYLRSQRRKGFVAFVSAFAMFGMGLGVFALIVVMSVMNGFDDELKNRILRVVPHLLLEEAQGTADWRLDLAALQNSPHLRAGSPYIHGSGLLSQYGVTRGVEIFGVDPALETAVSDVSEFMLLGEWERLADTRYGIVLGSLLARALGVSLGDELVLTLPEVSVTPAGVFPRSKAFTVTGIFEVGAQVDQSLALINLGDAQKLFRRGDRVDGLRLRFDDIYQAPLQLPAVLQRLPASYSGQDWSQTQGSLFQAVKLEKTVTGLLLGIIIAVAAFNIVTSLVMMVTEKRSDIAVLRTMGMTRADITTVFITQGVATGFWGIALGVLLGIPCALYLPAIMAVFERIFGFSVFDPSVYFVNHLPSLWQFEDTLQVCISAVVITLVATLYPAYRASLIEPAEALRYDT